MSTKTNDESKRLNKNRFFKELIPFLPKGRKIVALPGLPGGDIELLMKSKKIDKYTKIKCYESMKSKNWLDGITNASDFETECCMNMGSIGVSSRNLKFFYKDIIKSNIIEDCGDSIDFILADTCRPYDKSVAEWACSDSTMLAVVDNGIIGFNVNLNRSKIEGNAKILRHPCSIKMNGDYDDAESEYNLKTKMHIIANEVESMSDGRLVTIAMMNYWDDARSPMGYFLFRKQVDEKRHDHVGFNQIPFMIRLEDDWLWDDRPKRSYIPFMEFINRVGDDRIASLGIKGSKDGSIPFMTKDRIAMKDKRQVRTTKNGYYVSTNLNNRDKKAKIDEIIKRLDLDAECTINEMTEEDEIQKKNDEVACNCENLAYGNAVARTKDGETGQTKQQQQGEIAMENTTVNVTTIKEDVNAQVLSFSKMSDLLANINVPDVHTISSGEETIGFEVWTPAIANYQLRYNENNRNKQNVAIKKYVSDMTENKFGLSGDSIIIDNTGNLLNGQNRCEAIVKSGKPQVVVVLRNVDPDSRKWGDIGKAQNNCHRTQMFLKPLCPEFKDDMWGIVCRLLAWKNNSSQHKYTDEIDTVVEFVKNNMAMLKEINERPTRGTNIRNNPLFKALEFIFKEEDPVKGKEFCDLVYLPLEDWLKKSNVNVTSIISKLNNTAIKSKKPTKSPSPLALINWNLSVTEQHIANHGEDCAEIATILAWDAFKNNQEIEPIQVYDEKEETNPSTGATEKKLVIKSQYKFANYYKTK